MCNGAPFPRRALRARAFQKGMRRTGTSRLGHFAPAQLQPFHGSGEPLLSGNKRAAQDRKDILVGGARTAFGSGPRALAATKAERPRPATGAGAPSYLGHP